MTDIALAEPSELTKQNVSAKNSVNRLKILILPDTVTACYTINQMTIQNNNKKTTGAPAV